MGKTAKRVAAGIATGGLSESYRPILKSARPILKSGSRFFGFSGIPETQAPGFDPAVIAEAEAAQMAIQNERLAALQGIVGTQRGILRDLLEARRRKFREDLTTGPEGERFRQEFNRLGLLNSGAFNVGLANRLADLEFEGQNLLAGQELAGQEALAEASGQGFDALSQLRLAGLARQLGLQDVGTQLGLARELQQRQVGAQRFGSVLDLIGSILGGRGGVR